MNARRFLMAMALIGATRAQAEIESMRPTEVNGYEIVYAQYLPFRGNIRLHYPEDALNGFYPNGATSVAKNCAYTSFNTLLQLFFQNPGYLKAAAEVGATRRFVIRINDYTLSSVRGFYQPPRFWHAGNARDYMQGTWVWEATQSITGHCELPTEVQLKMALATATKALSNRRID